MKKRFYCADCGEEVSDKARKCPHCGSIFTAVRCPQCLFEGKAELFSSGCPVCGYMEKPAEQRSDASTKQPETKSKRTATAISPWFARIAGIVLLLLIVLLMYLLGRA